MTQLVLNIEQPSILPSLRKVLSLMDGVSIARPVRRARVKRTVAREVRYPELDRAIEEVRSGDVRSFDCFDDMMKYLKED